MTSPGDTQPDDTGRRTPSAWRRTLGELTLAYLPDATIEVVPTAFFPDSTDADWADRPELVTPQGHLIAGAGAVVAERGGHRLVIDAGLGPRSMGADETPPLFAAMPSGALPASCAAAGLDPDDVDAVAFTHLHVDHLGWATPHAVEGGRGLFPHAHWLCGVGELGGSHREEELGLAGEAERTREVADGEEVGPGMSAWALPGHTSGHTAWVLATGDDRRVVVFGDAMHSPAQVEHPEWAVAVDSHPATAQDSRRALIAELAQPGVLGLGMHFADRQLGRVADGRWVPERA